MGELLGQKGLPLDRLSWGADCSDLELKESCVDLWRIQSNLPCYDRPSVFHCLSKEERERAARFHFEKDRRSYRVTHACKRWIFARYLGVDPDCLEFSKGEWGKPALEYPRHDKGFRFNLSHSKGITLIGVSKQAEIGVDVEGLQTAERMLPIFDRFGAEDEKRMFRELKVPDQGLWMTAWWVSKEAYIKVVGRGLSLELSSFSVDLKSDTDWRFGEMPVEFGVGKNYRLRLLDVGTGHFGAVAVQSEGLEIRGYCGEAFISTLC
ncbi:4'-phosphopantetheinyl transferase superfamily protein [bacterium]|jgi:4'-phosphopantetheinyl transferase|nr:4'-phosphopantetheinyl transferase superfamily protein [bacterium]